MPLAKVVRPSRSGRESVLPNIPSLKELAQHWNDMEVYIRPARGLFPVEEDMEGFAFAPADLVPQGDLNDQKHRSKVSNKMRSYVRQACRCRENDFSIRFLPSPDDEDQLTLWIFRSKLPEAAAANEES